MPRKDVLDAIRKYTEPFRVTNGKDFRLNNFDPGDTRGLKMDKQEAAELLGRGSEWLAMEQDILYAQDSWSCCSSSRQWMRRERTARSSTSCRASILRGSMSFRSSSPRRGAVARFPVALRRQSSAARAHRHLQSLLLRRSPHCACAPGTAEGAEATAELVDKRIWDERLADIARFEDYLTRQGVVVLKFYLNLSREQQKKRFMERLDKPDKNWKFSAADVRERRYWDNYMHAYEEAIRATASKDAPWFVVPADNKWFSRLVVAAAIVEAVELLNLEYPKVPQDQRKELAAARAELIAEK